MPDQPKRKYTFKNQEYWTKVRTPRTSIAPKIETRSSDGGQGWAPSSFDISTASSAYSSTRGGGSTTTRRNQVARKEITDDLINLQGLSLPYVEKDGRISIREAIQICQRVYANIAIFRNTIDIMTEFSCAEIYLTGGNEASRTFVMNWLLKISYEKFQEFWMREYYKSGNVFVLKFLGMFTQEDLKSLKKALAGRKPEIPIRYTILNPADVVVFPAASFDSGLYRKVMNDYELQKIRERKTDEDKILYNSLPEDIKKVIDSGSWGKDGLWMPIEPNRLNAQFYKKQPYEPFAVPFGYPVLRDLNHKEELKKIDQAISRTIDNVILLVTMGEKKDADGNGMNPEAMRKMQELLQNESIGRVLVSDYTTKATFVIPDIGEILNPQKYEIVNQDIREGLLNILAGDDKFANAMMKTQIFLERLKEGRKTFINEFLQPEINAVCKTMGFKQIPKAQHQEIDLKDQISYAKIYTRLMEIGVLTPEQGLKAIQTGVFPEAEELTPTQQKYAEQRKAGMYNPLVGGVPQVINPDQEANRQVQKELGHSKMAQDAKAKGVSQPNATNNGRPTGSSGTPNATSNPAPAGTSKASLRDLSHQNHLVSLKGMKTTLETVSALMNKAEDAIKAKYSLAELNDAQKNLVYKLTANVISTTKTENWNSQLDAVIAEPEQFLASFSKNEISTAVDALALEHQVDTFSASLIYHSKYKAS